MASTIWEGPLATVPTPPVCPKKEHKLDVYFGDEREDPYYWLRDDERKDEEVLAVLNKENDYTKACFADTEDLQKHLFEEMKARIKEEDSSVPIRRKSYYYYERDEEGKQYRIYCRRPVKDASRLPTVHDTIDMEGIGEEMILFDENAVGMGRDFTRTYRYYSPDHTKMAYVVDVTGAEEYQLFVADLTQSRGSEEDELKLGPGIPKPPKEVDAKYHRGEHGYLILDNGSLDKCSTNVAWATDGKSLFYVLRDHAKRPYQVWKHVIGQPASTDIKIFEDLDERFYVSVSLSRDKRYLYISSASSITSEEYLLDASLKDTELKLIRKRETGVEYDAIVYKDHVLLITNMDKAVNFKVLATPLKPILKGKEATRFQELIPHNVSARILSGTTYEKHFALFTLQRAQKSVTIFSDIKSTEDSLDLGEGHQISFDDEVYELSYPTGEYDFSLLRYTYQSLAVPPMVVDYDMNTKERAVKKVKPVLGGFDKSNYKTERRWAKAHDGTEIPVSIVYRKDRVVLDDEGRVLGFPTSDGNYAPGPVLLNGYGSYEITCDPYFSNARISLLDRGVIFAIGHIRGGGEMGRQWYEDGKFLKKMNTFQDFVSVAEALVGEWHLAVGGNVKDEDAKKRSLVICGGSAGGMLMGAVANMKPELFAGVVADVPFVDCLTTMLDESIPLTVGEFEEWGNPKEEEYYWYMKSYSPYDNVDHKVYPPLYVTAGLNDSRVAYWEPAKWVAKLREIGLGRGADGIPAVFFKTDMGAGHMSFSGRFDRLKDIAREYAFYFKCFGFPINA